MNREFWRTVREAIQTNGKTARFCAILIVIALVATLLADR
jgi:hypothetical protein